MLKILLLASVLSAVCGSRYAYIGNHLVEFEDAPKQTYSFTYPKETYQEPQVFRNEQTTQDFENATDVQTTDVPTTTTTVTTEAQIVEMPTTVKPNPSPPGIIWSLVLKVIRFVKRTVMKVIAALLSPIFSHLSIPASYPSSTNRHYNSDSIPSASQFSSLVTPERLKRAADFLEMELKKLQSS